jgi:hypothetical protein
MHHRSFVLTQPEYMRGKRVKPHLRYLAYASDLFIIVEIFACYVGAFIVVENLGGLPGGLSGTVILIAILLLPHPVGHLTFRFEKAILTS